VRTIIHLSDLHFGTILEPTPRHILDIVGTIKPDLVVVSGDLTQRARKIQYAEARAFLDSLPAPRLVLPGNHDVPAYLFRRLLQPLDRYKRMIDRDLCPRYVDDEIAVLGINTARSLVIKGGAIDDEQLRWMEEQVRTLGDQLRIVVVHHPLDLPPHLSGVDLVDNAAKAMETFARCEIQLFLAGHLHLVYFGSTARYGIPGYDVPIMQAGTSTSTRARGEPNSFFVHRVEAAHIRTETHMWYASKAAFAVSDRRHFERGERGWALKAE
jgi:3',5'-cyclic AMP phosphodiesterase CpdA